MKNSIYILFSLFLLAFISCKTSSLSVEVLKPAEITIPGPIKTLAVVNRSLPSEDHRAVNILEGVLTGEGIYVDREASQRTIAGVANKLNSSPRFRITVPDGINLKGTGTSIFPEPLSWTKIEEICKTYSADAVVALETFDSNVSTDFKKEDRKRKENERTITYKVHIATLDIGIDAGWRIYYPNEKRIVDQNTFMDHKYWEGEGKNDDDAASKLPNPREAIKEAGFYAGNQYAYRISPMYVWVSRKYYKKGPLDFENAKLNVKANDWEGAKEIWTKYINDPDQKLAGYANYNMALYYEIQGDLEKAKEWAQKSYTKYYHKPAYQYLNQLKQRINDQERLNYQMN
jgi:Family of unknown function (DUF6340)